AVNGQVDGSPAAHASMSMLSFEPATITFGLLGSIAMAGSFCLFCENGVVGLPTVTSVSPPGWATATAAPETTATVASSARVAREIRIWLLLLGPMPDAASLIGPAGLLQGQRQLTAGPYR